MPSLDLRITLLRTAVIAGAAVTGITELLSFFDLLTPVAIAMSWLLCAPFLRFPLPRRPAIGWTEWMLLAPIFGILLLLGWISWLSPPNAYDALAYHLPRVVFWAQHGNVNFFPASSLNQLQMPPFAEYFTLHAWLLTGGDRLANFGQWFGYAGSVLAVSVLTGDFGASPRGQLYAAIFAATTPNAILQATGAKNDCVLTFWLLCACVFTRITMQTGARAWLAGTAIALAVFTKGTAYLFLPPLIAALSFPETKTNWRRAGSLAGATVLAILALNGSFYWRNFQFSGSPLGFDSAHGDGLYRVQNDKHGFGVTFSNAVRGLVGHIAFRDPAANRRVYETVLAWHNALGLDPNDPATTWRDAKFAPTVNSNHESNSPNRWHLAFLVVAVSYSLWRPRFRWFAIGWIIAWILFFAALRWQPYMTRLHLPLFLSGAVFIGISLDNVRPRFLAILVCLLLFNDSRTYLFANWLRPLGGPTGILKTSRDDNYFTGIASLIDRKDALEIVSQIARTDCLRVGIDTNQMELEYPFMALLLQRNPHYKFRHTDVRNASRRYAPLDPLPPCAILCLHCAPDRQRAQGKYSEFGPPNEIGRQLLFLRRGQ